MGNRHELKTWEEYFEHVWIGDKTFEYRKNDRNYKVGDVLILKEWNKDEQVYTGRSIEAGVIYILEGFGLPEDYVIMSIESFSWNK